ncbi:uncharacterized protein LOC110710744 isoform X3 [Chenopodium quinoa]|uniref:uncharacterized protein LOC110710744 isoform X3 n=1 Tax=Chenopodium quinoa TaxID=63459 RepID=UPI000B77857D|nr:uncharacterized protein LOC110710744 isoform X3 [Chenopodium quinoa]
MPDGGDEAGMRMSDSESSYDEKWDSMWENESSDDEAGKTLSDNGSPGDEPLAKKPKLASDLNEVTIDEHLEAIEEAALKELILDSCGNFLVGCKQLPGLLYDSLIEGLATLVHLLYDKEDFYRMGSSRMVIDQQNKFWEELAPVGEKIMYFLQNESVLEFCKCIFYKKVDRERYSLLTERDLSRMVLHYSSLSYQKPYMYYRVEENMKSTIHDDILKAIRKVKLCPRLSRWRLMEDWLGRLWWDSSLATVGWENDCKLEGQLLQPILYYLTLLNSLHIIP